VDQHTVAADQLRRAGTRYTPGRRALVSALAAVARPATIAQLLRQAHGLAQSSAYRNLSLLECAGVVRRVGSADRLTRFELVGHPGGHRHHHLVCRDCGEVADVVLPSKLDVALEAAAGRIGRSTGFDVQRHQVDLVGRCADCHARARG
jgi:Fur family ferric uptake transcriptional regulator